MTFALMDEGAAQRSKGREVALIGWGQRSRNSSGHHLYMGPFGAAASLVPRPPILTRRYGESSHARSRAGRASKEDMIGGTHVEGPSHKGMEGRKEGGGAHVD